MDLNSSKASPVLTERAPVNKSSFGLCSGLLPYSQSEASFPSGVLTIPRKKPGKLDVAWFNSWLDAMKSSSPPRRKILGDFNVEVASDDGDIAYYSWMVGFVSLFLSNSSGGLILEFIKSNDVLCYSFHIGQLKYPSAINMFEQIINHARTKKIVMFLDYDGTLAPIVDDPDRAFMSDKMRSAVRNVAKYVPTAIISGRSREKVHEYVGLPELYYAGSHGMDIMFPVRDTVSADPSNCIRSTDRQGKEINLFQPAREFFPMIDEVFRTLVENTIDIKGAKVENNQFCATVHYRNVDEKNWPIIAQRVHDILKDYPRLQLTHGRKVLEIRPVINWNKGKAVEFLLESLGLNNCKDVLPIYIGDDRTDEDAFKVLKDGNRGFGILVSSIPKETNASFSLRDPSEVKQFLRSFVRWKRRNALMNIRKQRRRAIKEEEVFLVAAHRVNY